MATVHNAQKKGIMDVHIYSRVGLLIIMPDALITDVNKIILHIVGTINLLALYLNVKLIMAHQQKVVSKTFL